MLPHVNASDATSSPGSAQLVLYDENKTEHVTVVAEPVPV